MDTLLTGSNGFLGKILKNSISSHSIRTLSRTNADYNLDLSLGKPEFEENFDLVIHLAGKAHSAISAFQESNEYFNTNVLGTVNLLNALEKSHLPRYFVFISSVSVYGLISGEFITEDFPLLAKDPYGRSKIQAESVVKEWCQRNDVICTILRLPLVVGSNPPGNLKAMIHAIKKGYYFNIADGHAKKSMVLASDIASFILKAAVIGGTYNLTDGVHPSFKELSFNIARQLGKQTVYSIPMSLGKNLAKIGDLVGSKFPINSNSFNKIISTLTFDDSIARTSFGWDPKPVLEEVFIK